MAVATEDEAKKQSGDNRTMGRKFTVPYGLYKANGFISAHLAAQTGFNEDDLNLFWDSLKNMFDHVRNIESLSEILAELILGFIEKHVRSRPFSSQRNDECPQIDRIQTQYSIR